MEIRLLCRTPVIPRPDFDLTRPPPQKNPRFDYTNDSLARRTRRVDNLTVTNDFGYNVRSEVIGALMGTNRYNYAYDPIGNRLTATNNAEGWTYLSNPLNQYTNIADGVIVEPEYDADGNMTATGDGWRYVWNGENRMILASNATTVVTYAYDHQGRMVAKTVDGSSRQYLWDGYNIIADARIACTNWFVWGLDLSGSLQGAGGVGGLLAEVQNGEPYFAAYDANGNVTEYISTNGVTEAHYEYSPFGEIVVQSGDIYDNFTHRFSTKPWCGLTGLSEYLFRKYEPGMGRWRSRDPIWEMGFVMTSQDSDMQDRSFLFMKSIELDFADASSIESVLTAQEETPYIFVHNTPVNGWDAKGLDVTLENGNLGKGYLNDRYHQAVCVDMWVDGRGSKGCNDENKWKCCHLGKRCFSFGYTGVQLPQFSSTWLGWPSTVAGAILQGKIYTPDPVPGAIVERRYITTMDQDFNLERYLGRRVGTPDGYSLGRHNCRKYSQLEFSDVPLHW